jgi:8-oxo-dGTP pyrophosphatase MutT (NUDIX family)
MGDPKKKIRRQHSAGGAVLRVRDGVVEVAMIATRGKTRWGLPKGALSDGETTEAAALREVREETNLQAEILSHVKTIEYFFRAGDTLIQKNVDFFLMRYLAGEIEPQLAEVDDVEWVPLGEAVRRASFDSERDLLERVQQLWSGLPEGEQQRFAP